MSTFTFQAGEVKNLIPLFNKLYSLKSNGVNNLTRYELYDQLFAACSATYIKLSRKGTKLTAYQFAVSFLRAEIDIVIGTVVASQSLEKGKSVAHRVRTSNTTGRETFVVSDLLPVLAGDEKIVKSLAKKVTADGKLFAIRTINEDGSHTLTVYRVSVRQVAKVDDKGNEVKKDGVTVMVSQKIATKESKSIQRFSQTESAFKKGVVKGLKQAI